MKKLLLLTMLLISTVMFSAPSSAEIRYYTAKDLDMSHVRDVKDKKKRFFDFMRPIVEAENARVLALREKLLEAKKNNNNKAFVAKVAEEYSVKDWTGSEADWKKLLERVDAVPLELVLAQSANESAWGQSRFAREGNNFFGQWCYKKGCGIVPAKRDKGARHEVAKFKSVNHSVRSYIKNINTGRVYAPLRQIRAQERAEGKPPSAHNQAAGLIKYSTRREAYVKEIRSMIRVNQKLMRGEA
ncbi:MAG TPA: flagellar biosynthesis protein FlgJ [Gammaproteobacteria bacterium]|nr:flagellar biosynthesis protein FlgJ [Gammaproteobacteria bacterium]